MTEIVARHDLTATTFALEVLQPRLATAARPGQFVLVMLRAEGERIPLTIADADPATGRLTLVIQAVGKTTLEMQQVALPGTSLYALAGPLGEPTHTDGATDVAVVGGGLGVAPAYPLVKAYRDAGVRVAAVLGFRSAGLAFWVERFAGVADEVVVCTDDGSLGVAGPVTAGLARLAARRRLDRVVAVGPPAMMQAVAEQTRPWNVSTVVSLNPIMVDGTGMCGGCRVTVGGETRFACVDGPEFDGHTVDFDELRSRLARFRSEESLARTSWECRSGRRTTPLGDATPAVDLTTRGSVAALQPVHDGRAGEAPPPGAASTPA